MTEAFGFFNINKPAGMTSHDVVAKIRRGLQIKKVGHAGTLDPMATGVLIVCVGGATRLSEYVMHGTKRYQARVHLGVTTDTYDADGEVLLERDASAIQRDAVEKTLQGFLGDIQQIPPMYSAIKQNGRKLYDLARAGQMVEREARMVRIDSLEISDWSPPEFTLDVTCSAGTYIRSLAYDVGEILGVGAHLAGLIRKASGGFHLDAAVSLDTLLSSTDWQAYLVPAQVGLSDWSAVHFNDEQTNDIQHGRMVDSTDAGDGQLMLAYGANESLIAIVQGESGGYRPVKVFLNE